MDELAYEHRSVLQVEHFARLAPILDMVEQAAGRRAGGEGAEAVVGAVRRVVDGHRASSVRSVQALVQELDAVLSGEGPNQGGPGGDVPQLG